MRVELIDCNGYGRAITSRNPALIGKWFAEHAPALMSADVRAQCRINIWPDDRDESKIIGNWRAVTFTQDGLLQLAEQILEASKKLGDLEAAAG